MRTKRTNGVGQTRHPFQGLYRTDIQYEWLGVQSVSSAHVVMVDRYGLGGLARIAHFCHKSVMRGRIRVVIKWVSCISYTPHTITPYFLQKSPARGWPPALRVDGREGLRFAVASCSGGKSAGVCGKRSVAEQLPDPGISMLSAM